MRLTKNNRYYGSTWYLWTDTEGEYQGYAEERGRISDKVPVIAALVRTI